MKTFVHEIGLTLNPSIRKQGVKLIINISDDIFLDSYPGPLGQVLINLINNAIIHAFNNLEDKRIVLEAEIFQKNWLNLKVSDNGNGIPINDQKKIFDPFFTTKLGQGGSGLGLHITHTLVTGLLGGRIDLKSAVGQGTTLILQLPLNAPASSTLTNADT